jgi:hypothetical protein
MRQTCLTKSIVAPECLSESSFYFLTLGVVFDDVVTAEATAV